MSQFPASLLNKLRSASSITVLTGAGVSAESGVPTFRDAQTGLWARYRAEDLATPEAFQANPRLVWEWYAWRRALVSQAAPNPAHYALAEMERLVSRLVLITQNVDGLHQQAGSGQAPGARVLELHGNIRRTKCWRENTPVEQWSESEDIPPRCPACGAYLRPDVVWFGEMLPQAKLQAAWEAAAACEVFFSIGTSGLVQPAASLPLLALENSIEIVEINPQPTPITAQVSYHLAGAAGVLLPALVQSAWK